MNAFNSGPQARRIAVVHWHDGEELADLFGDVIGALGHEVVPIAANQPLPQDLDAVFVHGPFGSLVPLGNQLAQRPAGRRPALLLWLTEQFWDPRLPDWLSVPIARARSRAERFAFHADNGTWTLVPQRRWLTRRGLRFRYFGDILWLTQTGSLSLLAVPSRINQQFLHRLGIPAEVAYCGAHPRWEAQQAGERDIPVLWLGKPGSPRRARALATLERDLQARGIALHRVDGIANPAVFGDARARLLRRTKIIVNLVRQPWDCNVLRFYLSAPNRTLMITEPLLPHAPIQPGVHVVESPLATMADTIAHYLADATARERISDAAYHLVTTELTMAKAMRQVLDRLWPIPARAQQHA